VYAERSGVTAAPFRFVAGSLVAAITTPVDGEKWGQGLGVASSVCGTTLKQLAASSKQPDVYPVAARACWMQYRGHA
jgi:hypothetical protein